MKHFSKLLLLLLAAAASGPVRAQTTGSFDTAIAFSGGARVVSLYVPPTYTAATKYRLLVCLHGLGDSCVTYRNGLIASLGWATAFPNTVFVCPEAATKSSDFYAAPGSEAIIAQSIAVAMAKYHIDTANVVLQGFSLGGRAALRYGLDHPAAFKGLLLNTPAIQGTKEAVNGRAPLYSFAYANAGSLPIYITHGATDEPYASPIDSAYELLVRADARVRYADIPGLGHAIPPVAQLAGVTAFFNSPAHAGLDAEAVLLAPDPLTACTAPATARLLFRNNGQVPLSGATFRYTLGGQTKTAAWTGTLQPFQHATVALPFLNPAAGDNPVTVTIDSLNGALPDSVAGNNGQATVLHYAPTALTTLNEGFEGTAFPPAGWVLEESGDFYTGWDADPTVHKSGSQSAAAINTVLYFDNGGRQDGLVTPVVTVPTAQPRLYFDVAYNYHRYTPPYLATTTDFADTLDVFASTDCGAHYTRLYSKGGAALATFATPITNALSVQAAAVLAPADSNWRTEAIDLSAAAAGAPAARFKFSYRSALGGSIRLDNVRVSSATGVGPAVHPARYAVYPNPADNSLVVAGGGGTTATLTNTLGQVVVQQRLAQHEERLDLTALAPGLYLLQLTDATGMPFTTRITKQ